MDITGYTLIISSLATSGAAIASWASVVQNRQGAQERRQPVLIGAADQLEDIPPGETTSTSLNILNTGGTAKNVACLLAVGDHYFANRVGPGFLRNQQQLRAEAKMPLSSERRALLMCRDLARRIWVWDLDGQVRTYDGGDADPVADFEVFWFDFYGEDLSRFTRVGCTVTI
jgi:hypothetical protein